jgi:hypothetical protein
LRDDEQLRPESLENTHRERDLLERIAFVLVESAFHDDDWHAFEPAADQSAAVARGRGFRKVRNGFIVERGRDIDLFDEPAETSAKDDTGVRYFLEFGLNSGCRGFDLIIEFEHEM